MSAAGSFLRVKVGLGLPLDKPDAGAARDEATRFYWSLFQMLNKDQSLPDGQQGRVLRLSFEDDFAIEDQEEDREEDDDDDDESGFIPLADFLNDEAEDDPREEDEDVKNEFSNK